MADPVPSWKFWHPLPFWQVLLIALVLNVLCILPFVALRELAGIVVPEWIAACVGGAVMFIAIRLIAQRRLAAQSK